MPIGTDSNCQNYVQNYIIANGPIAQFDNGLDSYCSSKYKGFGDLFNSGTGTTGNTGNQTDQQLCACHMPEKQYENFETQLNGLYPSFGNLGLVDECLLPQCASSQYKSTITTATCKLPQCINIASFTNEGTFNNSSVTITQSGGACANLVNNNAPINSSHTATIIIIVVSAIILIAVIIIVYYRSRERQVITS
jgi:hypothetical protein